MHDKLTCPYCRLMDELEEAEEARDSTKGNPGLSEAHDYSAGEIAAELAGMEPCEAYKPGQARVCR